MQTIYSESASTRNFNSKANMKKYTFENVEENCIFTLKREMDVEFRYNWTDRL